MIDIAAIPREQIPAVIAALAARLLEPAPAEQVAAGDDGDRLLTTSEAAVMLGHSTKWIYRHIKDMPFARRIGPRDFRFELRGLRKWQSRQKVDQRG
jgi:predicted DNA-binding transcriptional regulator AlpA